MEYNAEMKRRADRRAALREKNAAIVAEQRKKFLENSIVGEDGVRRRLNKDRVQKTRPVRIHVFSNV